MTSKTPPALSSSNGSQDPASLPRVHSFEAADLAAMAILVGSLLALFWRVIFTSDMLYFRDVFEYTYPHARFIQEACRNGYVPYWNPYINYGQPLLANPNFLFFYPYTLFIILLPIDLAYTMHYVVHFAVAAIGTYWLARRWEQSRAAALFAALVFTLSGPVLSLGNFYNHVAGAAWIPWALLLTDRAVESRARRPWILLTLVLSLQFLAGEPFTLIATFGLSLAYALYRRGTLRPLLAPMNREILGRFILVGCLLAALCAVQFLPSLDLFQNSRRGTQGMPYIQTTYWSFHPLSLLEVVLPDFYGASLEAPSAWMPVLASRNLPYLPSLFVGFVPLFFAFAGWALGRDRRRGFVAAAALVLFVLSLGRFTPVFALLYLVIPLFQLVRFPIKLLIPTVLLVSLLAGWGLDAVRQEAKVISARRLRILLPLKVLLAVVVLMWMASLLVPGWFTPLLARVVQASGVTPATAEQATKYFPMAVKLYFPGLLGFTLGGLLWLLALEREKLWARRALPLVVLLGLVQLVQVNSRTNPTVPRIFYTYRPPVLTHFENSNLPYRFCHLPRRPGTTADAQGVQGFVNFDWIPEIAGLSALARGTFRNKLLLAQGSMLERAESSLSEDVERAFPPFLYEFWYFIFHQLPEGPHVDYLLGNTNVKYEILKTPQTAPILREVTPISNGSAEPGYLYENLRMVPRVYVAGRASYSNDALLTLTRMSAPDFKAQEEVILNEEKKDASAVAGSGPAGHAEIVTQHPNRVILRAELTRPGYVVLLDRFDPNWRATVDGREVPILRANHLFRAVYAEKGRHEIRFYYRQRGLRAGLVISLVTLSLLATLYVVDPHRPLRARM